MLDIIELKDNYIKFSISGITPAIANSIRRTLINDIPKLAIENVVFHHGEIRDSEGNVYDSSLPLFDEVVALRLGLIPLKTDLKMNFRDQCSCNGEGCDLCTVKYSINKLGPADVFSSDLIPINNPDLKPVDPMIPIVKLKKGQAMLVTCEAIMGRGKDHAKWQVTSGVSYKYHREFKINKNELENWSFYKDKCPKSVISENENEITFTDDVECRYLQQLFDEKSGVTITEDDTKFIFQFETDGSLTAIETLDYALKRLKERFNNLMESLSE
ncbi:DNA-directed RNA polymerase subunit D [Picrophilus oshimae]|uniref:DNA-directed RNA polymerase subunit Rpo3 n=2 Tax=Picrophilus torridus (strain ATCC 700027 / DSM 9790 / JCM 10055 / NBRC 100828 / KAW 2/3) TaxID=1122961 RepID=RPO3_PICTO|nr:DNA-directed RNA polymerase subunit D [Picrophilus oshimae]Q6KZP5.1 RecName: Full=DNA-directed RNA polymerase subunit Rpo3; AltName: Full=DNA-directed RNA polymerase subunit D [Picrophilus oshimae DSM 9789]AAT43807.1 DNA-directed RNA polymerase subunit D [Picrophilus oshimae DSM 9789]SMD31125.1 DNA-directed RNA polymerase, subunit D [Picrophilus oshimae DSM 9789]